jgi:HTH-type transcriptional repressor of NAD biosynthesis genes
VATDQYTKTVIGMKFGLGVVIGKFLPPHRGHKLLVDTASAECDQTVAIVCAKPTDPIPGEFRQQWMQAIHPNVQVMLIDDRYDENDPRVWAENTVRWLGRGPDAVFTSEDYGEDYAALMGAKHVSVDRQRIRVPASGTAVRKDPYANWDFIEPPVQGWFAKRICVVGAESTGTTTLAQALASYFDTTWVMEYGREYSVKKQAVNDNVWQSAEFTHIAAEQARREDAAACEANRLLICDTNAFATTLWHRRYVGHSSSEVEAIAGKGRCDLYLLTGDEIPFVQDGLRDGEHIRHEMHRWFEEALAAQSVPWHLLRGTPDQRLHQAADLIEALFKDSAWKPPHVPTPAKTSSP